MAKYFDNLEEVIWVTCRHFSDRHIDRYGMCLTHSDVYEMAHNVRRKYYKGISQRGVIDLIRQEVQFAELRLEKLRDQLVAEYG